MLSLTRHIDDLLTFYLSDNDKSITGACSWIWILRMWFVLPGLVTNTFFREICIENGKSIGCVYEVTGDAVVEDITNFNFTFDWEEVDCQPCDSDNYVTTVPRYTYRSTRNVNALWNGSRFSSRYYNCYAELIEAWSI